MPILKVPVLVIAGPENAETKNAGIENAGTGIFRYWKIPVVLKNFEQTSAIKVNHKQWSEFSRKVCRYWAMLKFFGTK